MSDLELQEEEREVLLSIYDGDPAFKQLSPTTFQYKYGDDESPKSFLLELSWGPTYPSEPPQFNMDTFYNKHVVLQVKRRVAARLLEQSGQLLGEAMTYTLLEFAKEHFEELVSEQPETAAVEELEQGVERASLADLQDADVVRKLPKKEQLSKAQKRKQWDRTDSKGTRPRGWDWVDVVKHLSQTGSKQEAEAPSSAAGS
ncbi:RWD domain-containing protein 4 [Bacillus rossius redtenbacheri]|uniref:RWD domain-containing protein 4 n=1 Tax=Bacillus rossius redtenbacheri TaxID=93214 RepID=UPI002FDD9FA1